MNVNNSSHNNSMTDGHTTATVDSSSQDGNNGQQHQHQHQHRQHQHHQRKRKRVSDSESGSESENESESENQLEGHHKRKHIDQIDYTRTCAVDVLLHMTTFIDGRDVRPFAQTSKSNLSAMRRYVYKGTLWIVGHLLKCSRLLDEHVDDDSSSRSIFHPQFAFGQWSEIRINCDQLNLFHSWQSKRSNKSSVKLLGDYIQSHEMIKLNSPSLSLRISDHIEESTLITPQWLIKLFPLHLYKLSIDHQCNSASLSLKIFELLHDIVPRWNDIRVLFMWRVNYINDFIQPNCHFPLSLAELRLDSEKDDLSQVVLPASLKKFDFYCNQYCSTDKWPQIPTTLETLILRGFSQSLDNYCLPSSLTELQMTYHRVRGLEKCQVPSTLKLLKMAPVWKLQVSVLDGLPNSLETLQFGTYFNQQVDQLKLSPLLRSLIFGWCFNRSIDSLVLPQSLTQLCLGYEFNQPIRGDIFPPQLKSLILGDNFNRPIHEWKLPNSLTQLKFGSSFCQPICDLPLDYWPSALTELSWHQYPMKWIPSTLNAPYDTPFTSDLTGTHRVNTRDESLVHHDSSNAQVNANGNGMLKPIFDRTAERQRMRAYDRNDVIQILTNIRQAELNDLE